MAGVVQHLIVDPTRFARWSSEVARNDRFTAHSVTRAALPPVRHVVFIVVENKQFDEEFGDEPRAHADPTLLVYGRRFTPNLHALAERYTMFDEFMGNGDASIYGHSWTVQAFVNDYQERNARARDSSSAAIEHRVPYSIWPYPERGEDNVPISALASTGTAIWPTCRKARAQIRAQCSARAVNLSMNWRDGTFPSASTATR